MKGLVVALLSAVPVAILVAAEDPAAPLPIAVMSSVLGIAVGHLSDKARAAAPAAAVPASAAPRGW